MSVDERGLETQIRAAYADTEYVATAAELERIAARRVADAAMAVREVGWRRWPLAIAAVLLVGLAGTIGLLSRRPSGPSPAGRMAAEALLPSGLLAQGAPFPSYPMVSATRQIKPGEMSYAFLRHGQSFSDSTQVMRSRLERATWHDQPAWLMLGAPTADSPPIWRDSTWLDTVEVRQLARSVAVYRSEARIVEEFREHEVLRGYITPNGTTWTVIRREDDSPNPTAGYTLRTDALNLALRRAPIERGWKGSIALVVWPYYSRLARQWYDLSVVGEETVTVPAGTFDCWKIQLGPGPAREDRINFWVTKDKQWIAQWGAGNDERAFRMVLVAAREE